MRWYERRRNQRVAMINKGKLIILSKCAVCDTNKFWFKKEQETNRLLTSLGIKWMK